MPNLNEGASLIAAPVLRQTEAIASDTDAVHVVLGADALLRAKLGTPLRNADCAVCGETEVSEQIIGLARGLRPSVVLIQASLRAAADATRAVRTEQIAPVLWLVDDHFPPDLLFVASSVGVSGLLCLPVQAGDLRARLHFAREQFTKTLALETEIKTLNERMEARKLVGRAKAVLMERFRLNERDAFKRIQAQSTALNKPIHEIARAIITASEMSL